MLQSSHYRPQFYTMTLTQKNYLHKTAYYLNGRRVPEADARWILRHTCQQAGQAYALSSRADFFGACWVVDYSVKVPDFYAASMPAAPALVQVEAA